MTGHLGSSKLKNSPCRSRRAVLGTVTSMAWVLQFRRRPTAKRINTIHGQRELSKVHALVAPTKYGQSKQSCLQQAQFFYFVWLGYQTENPILCALYMFVFLFSKFSISRLQTSNVLWYEGSKTKIPEEREAKRGNQSTKAYVPLQFRLSSESWSGSGHAQWCPP